MARRQAKLQQLNDLCDWRNWLDAWAEEVQAETGLPYTRDRDAMARAEARMVARGILRPEVEAPERLRRMGPFASR